MYLRQLVTSTLLRLNVSSFTLRYMRCTSVARHWHRLRRVLSTEILGGYFEILEDLLVLLLLVLIVKEATLLAPESCMPSELKQERQEEEASPLSYCRRQAAYPQ